MYLLFCIAGILYILVPPTSVSALYIHYNIYFIEIFGIFYAAGGFTSLAATIGRKWLKLPVIPTWHFENAGLFLLGTASIIYSVSLFSRGLQTLDLNTLASGLIFIALTSNITSKLLENILQTRQFDTKERKKDAR